MDITRIGNYDILNTIGDDSLYSYAEKVYRAEDYDSPDEFLQNITSLEYFANDKFNKALESWYETQGKKISDEVRGYVEYGRGFLMTHGGGYDWKSADLCGGSGNGVAWKEFENWVDTNNIDIE